MKINISGFKFDPATVTVKVGATVTWTNQDSANHTVTGDDGSWTSESLAKGATFSFTFDKAGNVRLPLRRSFLDEGKHRRPVMNL